MSVKSLYYSDPPVVLATKHGKEKAIARPFRRGLGWRVFVPGEIDTDLFGTFTGEIERSASPAETALSKARLGIRKTGVALGLASEGSFGPHPEMPFRSCGTEILVFVDERRGFHVCEQLMTTETNFASRTATSIDDLDDFLQRIGFPHHALIVRANNWHPFETVYKGLQTNEEVRRAIETCTKISTDRLAHVETDMRAHVNPTRMGVIQRLAMKMIRRLKTLCPGCATPGFGIIGTKPGLKCGWCQLPTRLISTEIHGCAVCDFHMDIAVREAEAEPQFCDICNP